MKINDIEDENIAEYLTFNFRQMQKINFNQEIQKTGIFRIREGEDFGLKSPVSEFSKDLGSFSFVGKDSLPEMHKRALLEISKEKSRDASVTSSIRSASSQVKSKTPLSIKTSPSSFTPKQSSVLSPSAVVHSPSRFSANKQAMVTTDSSWNILVANNLFCLMLEKPVNEVINMNITSFFSEPYNEKQKIFLEEKMNKTLGGGGEPNDVWICGKIIRLNKGKGSTAASVWLKRKEVEKNQATVFVWVFEEIKETQIVLAVEQNGNIKSFDGPFLDLFEYSSKDVGNIKIGHIIPGVEHVLDWIEEIKTHKFFGAITKSGKTFPVILKVSPSRHDQKISKVQVISMPNISGVITVSENDVIESCNSSFTKYLFGFPSEYLAKKEKISKLLHQFDSLKENMLAEKESKGVPLFSATFFRKLFTFGDQATSPTASRSPVSPAAHPNGCCILAYHRDGTAFYIDVQIRMIKEGNSWIFALWITFDRPILIKDFTKVQLDIPVKKSAVIAKADSTNLKKSTSCLLDHYTSINNYVEQRKIGEGAFGCVYIAKSVKSQKNVVLKSIKKSKILKHAWVDSQEMGHIPREIYILDYLHKNSHPNIVTTNVAFQDDENIYIDMELHGHGMDLFDFIDLNPKITEEQIKSIFHQICCALQHLHKHKIVHRDIKDENVIIDDTDQIKLIDFGSADFQKDGGFKTFCGTMDYVAPEVLQGNSYKGPPQDIWALGILLYTLIYKENPFYNMDEIMDKKLRPPYIMSKKSLSLLQKMLNRDVDSRATIDQVLNDEWFK